LAHTEIKIDSRNQVSNLTERVGELELERRDW